VKPASTEIVLEDMNSVVKRIWILCENNGYGVSFTLTGREDTCHILYAPTHSETTKGEPLVRLPLLTTND